MRLISMPNSGMRLLKLLFEHGVPALLIGVAAYFITGNAALVAVSLLTGWLIDADHLVDFAIALARRRSQVTLHALATGSYFAANGQIFVLLHSWELVITWTVGWHLAGETAVAVTGALAWTVHLLSDHRSYPIRPGAYWLVNRYMNGFRKDIVCRDA